MLYKTKVKLSSAVSSKWLYRAVSSIQAMSKRFTLYFPASIHAAINERRLHIQISTTVCSQVLIQLSELEHNRVGKLAQGFTLQPRIQTRVLIVPEPLSLQYLSTVPVYSTCLQYLSTVPVYSTCLQYLSTVPVYSTCLQYLSTVQ